MQATAEVVGRLGGLAVAKSAPARDADGKVVAIGNLTLAEVALHQSAERDPR